MKLTRNTDDRNIIINTEQDFQTDLGWQENLMQLEDEVLKDIINPVDNYETVRFIHKPYNNTLSGVTLQQTDIWFQFFFLSGSTYYQDYEPVGITKRENELMLRQSTESFFRLEFFKTPWISGTTYEAPTRKNRRLVFTKNLSLPLGEKFFYSTNNSKYYIHIPVFTGSNYRNKENMYLFWFEDEKVLEETDLIGTETSNTFFMTAKFFNAKDGSITDFTNRVLSTGATINEQNDMYYRVDFDLTGRTYSMYTYTGGTSNRVGTTSSGTSINFYEKGGGVLSTQPLFGNTPTPTPTPTQTNTPTPTPTITVTPTPTLDPNSLNLMSGVKSGATLNLLCNGGGSSVNIYFSGTSIQLGEKLYANNTLPNPTPVINGRYYYPTYETIYVVTGGLGSVTSTEFCPTPTPLEYTIENIWTSDALSNNPTEQDLTYAILDACNGTSNINSSAGLNGTATMTGWGNNICNALRVYNIQSLILSEVTSTGNIILRQTLNNFDGSGGNKNWYRQFQRQLLQDSEGRYYFLPIGGCSECGVDAPTPTPIPLINVNIYGNHTVPYDAVNNNVQLIYQQYYAPTLGSIGYTTTGIQKSTTESGTYLTSISVNQGGNLNLGIFRRVTDGECAYREIRAYVFADGDFSSTKFNDPTGALLTYSGYGLQGEIYGVSIPVSSQSLDIYVTYVGTDTQITNTPPLPCLVSTGSGGNPL